MIKAVGAGNYGSIAGTKAASMSGKTAAGNSRLFPAKNPASLNAMAKSHTQEFISNARQVARGASGISKISIKA